MRIVELSPQITSSKNTPIITNRAKTKKQNQIPVQPQYNAKIWTKSFAYHPAFKGYREDKEFVNTAINMLDNAVNEVNSILYNSYEIDFDNDFLEAVEYTKQNKELYEKITETPEIFDKIASGFNLFSATTLKSLEDIRYDKKYFSPY